MTSPTWTVPPAMAEEAAMEWHADQRATSLWPGFEWEQLDADERRHRVAVHARALADLNRPASRDAAARELARRVGLECGATAPTWSHDSYYGGSWVLLNENGTRVFCEHPVGKLVPGMIDSDTINVPGIKAITRAGDPAEALSMALAATEGR